MKPIKAFSKAALLSAAVVFGSTVLHAETISQSNGVTTVRGVDDAASAEQRQSSRGRSGVVVFRGASSDAPQAPASEQRPAGTRVLSGQNLWIYDLANKEVTACSLRYDFYGNRTVRCSSDN
jgi:hypothetical protein